MLQFSGEHRDQYYNTLYHDAMFRLVLSNKVPAVSKPHVYTGTGRATDVPTCRGVPTGPVRINHVGSPLNFMARATCEAALVQTATTRRLERVLLTRGPKTRFATSPINWSAVSEPDVLLSFETETTTTTNARMFRLQAVREEKKRKKKKITRRSSGR